MKKLFLFFCIVIMFLGFVGWPSSDDSTSEATTSSVVTKSGVGSVSPLTEPATLILLGTGLVGLAGYGRKRFKK